MDLAGVREDLYYKLPIKKFFRPHNHHHASLGASGFRRSVLPLVERCCSILCAHNKSPFIDMYLWAEATCEDSQYTAALCPNKAEDGRALHVGFKMMPGPKNLGMGGSTDGAQDDAIMSQLRKWIGNDIAVYKPILAKMLQPAQVDPASRPPHRTGNVQTHWV